jgi:hypothetical protein
MKNTTGEPEEIVTTNKAKSNLMVAFLLIYIIVLQLLTKVFYYFANLKENKATFVLLI